MKKRSPTAAASTPPPQVNPPIDLHAMELEVLEEGREWMRRRLQEKLKQTAQQTEPFSPSDRTET